MQVMGVSLASVFSAGHLPKLSVVALHLIDQLIVQAVERGRPAGRIHQHVGAFFEGAGRRQRLIARFIDLPIAGAQLGEVLRVGEAERHAWHR